MPRKASPVQHDWAVHAVIKTLFTAEAISKATFSFSRLPGLRGIRRAAVAKNRRECDARAFLTCLTTQELKKGRAILSVNDLVRVRKKEWLAGAYLLTDCLSIFHQRRSHGFRAVWGPSTALTSIPATTNIIRFPSLSSD